MLNLTRWTHLLKAAENPAYNPVSSKVSTGQSKHMTKADL